MPSPILGGGSEVSVVKLDITQVPETWIPDPNSGGGTFRPCSLLARTVPSHGTEPRSILGRVTLAPIDHWLDRRAFNPEKADRNRLGVCPRSETGHHGGLRNRSWGFKFSRGRHGSSAGAQLGFISLAVEIDTRWSYRGEGLLVSRLSGGQEIAGSTPAISTEVKA